MNLDISEFWSTAEATVKVNGYKHCSRWAPEIRVMPDGEPYSLDRYPYMREILDTRAPRNVTMKGAQTGASEGGFTTSFFEIDYHKRDVIYYFPTGKMAERFSKTRFKTAINLSPYLSKVVEDSIEIKQIGNATLHILGANSMTNLKGTSAGRLVFDELDEWTDQQIYLAEERAAGQKDSDKIIWMFSTPKYPNCGIHKQYLKTTQERFFFDCPHCKKEIKLDWEDQGKDDGDFGCFQLFGESTDDERVHESYIKCPECNEKLEHYDKPDYMADGRWIATNLEACPGHDPARAREAHARGFHISQLYSPTVAPYEIAVKYLRSLGDEDARREFHNSCLGLPYVEDAHRISDAHIDAAIKKYSLSTSAPNRASDGVYTLGIDQGGPVHHWAAVKWLFDASRDGDPNDRAIGRLVGCGRILQDDWAGIHGLMRGYQIRMAVIDYFPNPTSPRVFARKFPGAVYLCQYVQGTSGREVRLTEDDYGANLVKCDKVGWLTKSLGRIMNGDLELPLDLPLEMRQHLKAPVRSLTLKNDVYVAEYVETGADHYAHAINYAEIALKILDPGVHSSSVIKKIR